MFLTDKLYNNYRGWVGAIFGSPYCPSILVEVGSVAFVAENYFLLGNSSWGHGGGVHSIEVQRNRIL